jgi:hypothetical protein
LAFGLMGTPALAEGGPVAIAQDPATGVPELELTADTVVHDELAHTIRASGNLIVTYGEAIVTADELVFDTVSRRGSLKGPIAVKAPTFSLEAETARFDLVARRAELERFSGRWANRAQVGGAQLTITEDVITMRDGFVTPCQAPEPDLKLGASRLQFYPRAELLNLAAEGVTLQVWDRTVLAVPAFSSTIGQDKEAWRSDFLPRFGFDAYHGFLTSTRLDFSLGENSRGTIPVTFSTGRGWTAAVEHFLAVGPGELQNTAQFETPWAVSRGGFRFLNAYRFSTKDGSRWDLALDHRADMNGIPVSRLPDVAWVPPSLQWPGVVTVSSELRAGYLIEEPTEMKTYRLRWAAPFSTVIWQPLPFWQTWVSGMAFANRYQDSQYGGGVVGWQHRQPILPDFALTEGLELQRVYGETPFAHDRIYDTERLRLGIEKDWGARFSTRAGVAFSRVHQATEFSLEDMTLGATYRWNCFSFNLNLRPVVYGVDFNMQLLNF